MNEENITIESLFEILEKCKCGDPKYKHIEYGFCTAIKNIKGYIFPQFCECEKFVNVKNFEKVIK